MVRVLHSYKKADEAIQTLKTMFEVNKSLTPDYLDALKESLKFAKRGVRQHFYEKLAREVPEALVYFKGQVGSVINENELSKS